MATATSAARAIAPGKEIHVVLDNGSSHTAKHTKAWLAAHPRWHVRWTPPHASWHNQVELFFSALTRRVMRHGDFATELGSRRRWHRCGCSWSRGRG
ncbi:transposase [Streptomyces albidoflavus]|uniref:transposase n=1 Tax=Streptomyces albidoflavus TaxID=1886 RepID=UPI00224F8606|nr:transposase [Streptomyces albidoflavus]MCX4441034.1 transposase [Streptomyces albidoflavus]WTB77118.1 transposase [Streptomyces albidoflavus]